VSAYVRAYHHERQRLHAETARQRAGLERKLADANAKIERLVRAITEGLGNFGEIKSAMEKAKAARDDAAAQLATVDAVSVLALHPGIADEYRRNVEALGDALRNHDAASVEAVPRLRALIAHVVITPTSTLRGVEIEVVRRLDEALKLAGANALIAFG
jgi:hypothetical protein